MAKTHYETLGVAMEANESEIKAAYRRMVLRYHPDRSKDPNATQIFQRITLAFETLSDPIERNRYDLSLQDEKRRAERRAEDERRRREEDRQRRDREKTAASVSATTRPRSSNADASIPSMLTRLSVMFSRQQFSDCERLAREILRRDAHQALPYAVLGDICRARGNLEEAARFYSYALQMQPQNELYLKRYEEILDRAQIAGGIKGKRLRIEPEEKRNFAILTILAVVLLACFYIIWAPEKPALSILSPVSTWTMGMVVMLFVSGCAAGAALAVGNLIDRLDPFSNGKISPAVLLGVIAFVSFPAACVLYFAVGFSQRAFNITTTRLIAAVGAVTGCLAVASLATNISFSQVLLWGGNLAYIGALCGWMVADGLRKP